MAKRDGKSASTPHAGINKITRTLADGSTKIYYYDRATGARLKGEPGSLEFETSLRAARRKPASAKAKSIDPEELEGFAKIIHEFKKKGGYKKWCATTQKENDRRFAIIIDRFQEFTCDDIGSPTMRAEFYEFQDDLQDTPAAADAMMALLSRILHWAFNRSLVTANTAYRMERLTRKGTRAGIVLDARHDMLVAKHADPELARIYLFSKLATVRASDARRLKWSNLENGRWLVFEPSKTFWRTGQKVHLPVFMIPELMKLIGTRPESGDDYIFQYKGEQWNARTLKQKWMDFRRAHLKEEIETTHWHDIRGSGTQLLLDAGCTNFETACVTGHKIVSNNDEAQTLGWYAKASRKGARRAFKKLNVAIGKGCLTNPYWDEEDDDEPQKAAA